jgi:hypothetical protein
MLISIRRGRCGYNQSSCWCTQHLHCQCRPDLVMCLWTSDGKLPALHHYCFFRWAVCQPVRGALWRCLALLGPVQHGLISLYLLAHMIEQFTVAMGMNATAEIEAANAYPFIRLFSPALFASQTPLNELNGIMQPWSQASSISVGGGNWTYFSAV